MLHTPYAYQRPYQQPPPLTALRRGGLAKRGTRNRRTRPDAVLPTNEALDLRFRGVSYREIAEHYGVDVSTVAHRLRRFLRPLNDPDSEVAYQAHRAGILSAAEFRTVEHMMDPDKLRAASFRDLAGGFWRLFSAGRLERGQSTTNVSTSLRATLIMNAHSSIDAQVADQIDSSAVQQRTTVALPAPGRVRMPAPRRMRNDKGGTR